MWFDAEYGLVDGKTIAATSSVDFRTWLQEVGVPHSQYLGAFVGRYAGKKEAIAAYSLPGGKVNPQLFHDVNIQDLGHQHLFRKWFAAQRDDRATKEKLVCWMHNIDWAVGELANYRPRPNLEAIEDP